MKFSNFAIVFMGIAICFGIIIFMNVDITKRVGQENVEYGNKLTSACWDAAKTMRRENLETYGHVWHNNEDLNNTLDVFYTSLTYSFNWDTQGRVNEMALYTPVVCLVDMDGYYISHNVVFNQTGLITTATDPDKRNGLTSLNTWTQTFGNAVVRFYLNDYVTVYAPNSVEYKGERVDVLTRIMKDFGSGGWVSSISFLGNTSQFNKIKNALIVREINDQCEYYINRHNVVGDNYEMQYTFELPEISGEEWARLLEHPTVISFLQGYSSIADNRMLNIYSLAGGELTTNYHYFIDPSTNTYHCIEACRGVTKSVVNVPSVNLAEGTTTYTQQVQYYYHGNLIEAIYSTQTECARLGATPHECVYDWNW